SLPTSSACRLRSLPGRGYQSPRTFSSTAGDGKAVLIYTGAHAGVIRTLKRVSLTTCIIGLFSTPFFLTLGSESVPMKKGMHECKVCMGWISPHTAANVALTGIVLLATCGPTILLHAFTKPYIFALRVAPFVTADNDLEISDSGKTMATKAQQKENLEKVTDYVEESVLDADRMAKAMSSLESDKSGARAAAAKLASSEWAAVKVNPNDVKFIVGELEVTSEAAEQALKESGGDVVKALQRLLP
ncbi:hypothetical protein NGA_0204200, partial [Nannochloropsis gaditana CCMP526]|uniref:uncharacterized protein n=1 Tax=Nannochloropsis gaditana (strain CCMP526) TaxID=1093141 RepID=UPI00029F65DF